MEKSLVYLLMFLVLLNYSACNNTNNEGVKASNIEVLNTEEQTIVINHQRYNVHPRYNENQSEIDFIDAPQDVQFFFEKYNETFVPHVVQTKKGLVIYYYKDWNDLLANVKMIASTRENDGNDKNGNSKSYLNVLNADFFLQQHINRYRIFNFDSLSAWGQTSNFVGSYYNDKISLVRLENYSDDEAIHYLAGEDVNWDGKRLLYTLNSKGESFLNLSTIRLYHTANKNWSGVISSCETWQSKFTIKQK